MFDGDYEKLKESKNTEFDWLNVNQSTPKSEEILETTFNPLNSLNAKVQYSNKEELGNSGGSNFLEDQRVGFLKFRTYLYYFYNGNTVMFFAAIILCFMQIFFTLLADLWLAAWADYEEFRYFKHNNKSFEFSVSLGSWIETLAVPNYLYVYRENSTNLYHHGSNQAGVDSFQFFDTVSGDSIDAYDLSQIYLNSYINFCMMLIVVSFVKSFTLFGLCVNASRNLHEKMLKKVLKAPFDFFQTHCSGRIVNRFSKDFDICDETIPSEFAECSQSIFVVLSCIIFNIITNFYIIIPTIPFAFLSIIIRRYYLRASVKLKRLQAIYISPILSQMEATFMGVNIIKIGKKQEYFTNRFFDHLNNHSRVYITSLFCDHWLNCRVELLCCTFFSIVVVMAISMAQANYYSSGTLALIIAYVYAILDYLQSALLQSVDVENYMVSVERIQEYCSLSSEVKSLRNVAWDLHKIKKNLEFQNVTIERKNPPIRLLDNVSFRLESGQKMAVVGQSGAGKTTLISAILRLIDCTSGSIFISDCNIESITLTQLRKSISLMSQDSFLFTGSLRENLDPINNYCNAELTKILSLFEGLLPQNLDFFIQENGENFSCGQRHLICFARVLLGRSPFVIFDEVTANVDEKTEQFIYKLMNELLSSSTVITITHRLKSIMDFDVVAVLENGKLIEFGPPKDLLNYPNVDHMAASSNVKVCGSLKSMVLNSKNI